MPLSISETRRQKKVVKFFKSSLAMQMVLNLFKRFEFQVGTHLEDIDKDTVKDIEG